MQLVQGRMILSATDLVGYLACDHLTSLDVDVANGVRKRPIRHDPELDLIEERGLDHERRFLESIAQGKRVANLEEQPNELSQSLDTRQARTLVAMRDGADVIYQGTFFDGHWRGHPDFLIKVDTPSDLGNWSYEVADAKLARHVKAAALLQCCVYSDLLARLQGKAPENVRIVTGDATTHSYRLADYASYFRSVRKQFEDRLASESGGATYPDPVDHCRICRWYGDCADRRRADDHLCRVAGMTRANTKALVAGSLPTLTQLGQSPAGTPVKDVAPPALERLRNQARLQLEQYRDNEVRYELIAPDPEEPNTGLARLPEPCPLDVFLDFESHPWATENGLEYLIGTVVEQDGKAIYDARWAHTPTQEKRAFEALIDFIEERRRKDERMHVYHYGAYERSAISRLMGRHATREQEVDGLLRGGVLVDLYAVVRQGVRVSQESYSLKKVEKLYMPKREGPSTEPGFAFVEYERWLREKQQAALDNIQAYNRDDCISAWMMRAWLEDRRSEAEGQFGITLGRPTAKTPEASEDVAAAVAAARERFEKLMHGVPDDPAAQTDAQRGRALLARLLEWHRRENNPGWWRYFFLRDSPEEDLFPEPDALTGLTYEGVVGKEKSSLIHRYRYDPDQEHKLHEGKVAIDPRTEESAGTIWAVDPAAGTIDLKRGVKSDVPHPRALIPRGPIDPEAMREALGRVADDVIDNGIDAPGRYRAVRDLLLRRPPRVRGTTSGQDLTHQGEDIVIAARRIALDLDETCLAIQGPPGTGKTYTGARMILSLVKAGKRVGIAATAHKAITNLVDALCDAAEEEKYKVAIVQRVSDEETGSERPQVQIATDNKEVTRALEGEACRVIAGTQWLFSRKEMADSLDVLFVDEAGQMSLANVVAMGGAAKSVVLLGDPNQLPQVTQGSHPDGAQVSALEHVLSQDATIAPHQGLFLAETRRLHPAVCDYISDAFYESLLEPHESTAQQQIAPGKALDGAGIRFLPVAHQGNAARSREEGQRVAELVAALVGRRWTNQRGETRPLTVADILIVAPYNAQVGEITRRVRERTGHAARVGTVDKFQGQEGAVVLFSMATSSPEDAPRNAEFLYSRHRLNVAISRARALAVLICSPDLLRLRCRTPEQMRLANAFCRLLEVAGETS
jgi:uncharacterized protein